VLITDEKHPLDQHSLKIWELAPIHALFALISWGFSSPLGPVRTMTSTLPAFGALRAFVGDYASPETRPQPETFHATSSSRANCLSVTRYATDTITHKACCE